jgi:ABC-type dipeptide/oligopeptide/nickel transport system permease subunit
LLVNLIESVYRLLWGDLFTIPLGGGIGISFMVVLLFTAGIWFTCRTRLLPVRLFRDMIAAVCEKKQGRNGLSSFQTLVISTATRVGMGNLVGVVAALVNLIVGVLYGGIAGYFGGAVDNIMMRIVDTISSIPMMLYVILIMVVLGSGLHSIILAMGLTYWVGMVRIVRSQVLTMREQEFVSAAVLLGVPTRKILVRHLIPNAMGPIMVALTMQIPSAMFTEAFLSFIGLGVSKPQASWGALANAALPSLYTSPYQLFYPALIMSITILALNLFSDGLRDSLDPRLRK